MSANAQVVRGLLRLWVVASALWAIGVGAIVYTHPPSESRDQILARWVEADLILQKSSHPSSESLPELRIRLYGSATNEQIATHHLPSATANHGFDPSTAVPVSQQDKIDREYNYRLDHLTLRPLLWMVFFAFGIWFAPVAAVFALGAGVLWVVAGFRPDQ